MTSESSTSGGELSAVFETRTDADRALERLRAAGIAERRLTLREGVDRGAARGACLVMVSGLDAGERDHATRLLHEAGGERVEASLSEHDRAASDPGEARPVQPGFADAAPGYVPDAAEFPATREAGAGHGPDEVEESKGRFAEQLDRLPERGDRSDR